MSFDAIRKATTSHAHIQWSVLLDRWQRLQPYADRFATAFFDTLFALQPGFLQIFGSATLDAEFLRFAHLLTEIVSAADDADELPACVERVVQRFARDDCETDRSRAVRAAIHAMLAEVAAADMTPHMWASWHAAYVAVTAVLRGARLQGDRAGAAAIRYTAVTAELAADRRSSSIERLMEQIVKPQAA
jgi:hemoglobin-like flavoprotein